MDRPPSSQFANTISQPGNYFLANDLVYFPNTRNAITINSSNVNLDFPGHVLALAPLFRTTPTTATAIVIGSGSANPENVTVMNGTIIGFLDGIDPLGRGHVIEGMRLEGGHNAHGIVSAAQGCLFSNNYIADRGNTGILTRVPITR